MAADVIELRVHGVSGMRAGTLLDRPLVVRVAGDRDAGFYRPRPGFGEATGPGGAILEAYHWSNLTASNVARGLMQLLLLPFMLSNLAIWSRPSGPGSGAFVKALCRLLGATLTGMFVLTLASVSLDLVAWQCASYAACTAGRAPLSWLGSLPVGPRLALLAMVPIIAIWVVSGFSARAGRRYEGFSATAGSGGDRLDASDFWHTAALVARLRLIHVAIAFGTLDASLLLVFVLRAPRGVGIGLLVAAVTLLVAALVLLCVPGLTDTGTAHAGAATAVRVLGWAAGALTVLTLAYAALLGSVAAEPGRLPGHARMVDGFVGMQAVLLVMLAAVVVLRRHRADESPKAFCGLGSPLLASAAVGLGAALSAALVYRTADVLDRGAVPTTMRAISNAPLQPPATFRWAALGTIAAVLTVLIGAFVGSRLTRSRRHEEAAKTIEQDFRHTPPDTQPQIRKVRDIIVRARLAERLSPLLCAYLVLTVLSLVAAGLDLAGFGPIRLAARLTGNGSTVARTMFYLTDVGTYLVELIALGILIIGVLAYRSADLRGIVTVLWDLGSFWPRTAHPFAPPCYAERALPEMARRIQALAGKGGVLLSGHSHGSVMAAATILQLPPETLRRVALLTYGSPLGRLYARLFPAYLGDEVLREVGDRVGWRWVNLWRHTDPTGGWIFSPHSPGEPPRAEGAQGGVDCRLRDPRSVSVDPMDTVPPPIEGHWPYHTNDRYAAAVADLAGRLDLPSKAPGIVAAPRGVEAGEGPVG
ncbi:hypothetical protein [Micromonospora sp. NPDC049497]|uniref:hypothetical protein n=1 Tax=Micromonospora sp. NPDC049497 TaxID=3364273 RepID=UPI0037999210